MIINGSVGGLKPGSEDGLVLSKLGYGLWFQRGGELCTWRSVKTLTVHRLPDDADLCRRRPWFE